MKVELVSNCLGRVSRINLTKIIQSHSASSSLSRMDSRSQSRAPIDEPIQIQAPNTTTITTLPASTTTTEPAKVKRNLFGRLNHDLLKSDLNEMWKETKERQKMRWNFDFDTLRPLNASNTSHSNQIQANTQTRYEWSFVDTNDDAQKVPEFYKTNHLNYKSRHTMSSKRLSPRSANKFSLSASGNSIRNYALHFASCMQKPTSASGSSDIVSNLLFKNDMVDSVVQKSPNKMMKLSKLMNSDDDSDECESEVGSGDEKVAPVGVVEVATVPENSVPAIFTMTLRQTTLTKKKAPTTNTASRSPRSKSVPGLPSLIITHSENRKDTLRSAKNSSGTGCQQQRQSRRNSQRTKTTSSVSVDDLKQQSLLDMLKQRKRRNVDQQVACDKAAASLPNSVHNCSNSNMKRVVNQLQRLPNEIDIQI